MKKLSFLLSALLIISAGYLSACNDDEEPAPNPDTLELGTGKVTFQYDQLASQEVSVETNAATGFDHEITAGDWFTVANIEKAVRITPKSENESTEEERKGTIRVTAGTATPKTIEVIQSKKGVVVIEDELRLSTNEVKFAYDELTARNVTVTTNVQAGFQADITTGDWFEVDHTDSGISITPKNVNQDRDNERTGRITVTAGDADPEIIEVIQTKNGVVIPDPYLEIDPTLIEFKRGVTVSPKRVDVDTNIDEGYTIEIATQDEWITIEDEENDYFTVTVGQWNHYEDREGEILVKAGDFTKTVRVVQEATVDLQFEFELFGTIDPSAIPAEVTTIVYVETTSTTYIGDYDFTITRWQGAADADVRVALANGNSTLGQDPLRRYLTIEVVENETEDPREFNVLIFAKDKPSENQTLAFIQEGMEIEDFDLIGAITELDWWLTGSPAENYFGGEWEFSSQAVYFNKVFGQERVQVYFDMGDRWFGEEVVLIFEVREGNRLFSLDNQYGNTMRDYRCYMAAVGEYGGSEARMNEDMEWEYGFDAGEAWIRPKEFTISGGEDAVLAIRYAPVSDATETQYSLYNIEFTQY